MENTKIEWADHTANFWSGCTKVSPGCANCYAAALSKRAPKTLGAWGPSAPRRRHVSADKLLRKLERKQAELVQVANLAGEHPPRRPRVFVNSLADWLDPEVPVEWLADLLAAIHAAPHLDFLLLTKRPELFGERVSDVANSGFPGPQARLGAGVAMDWIGGRTPPRNVWIGTTVEDQQRADERIPHLLKIPARVRFLSCEPLISAVDVRAYIGTYPMYEVCQSRRSDSRSSCARTSPGEAGRHDLESSGTAREPMERAAVVTGDNPTPCGAHGNGISTSPVDEASSARPLLSASVGLAALSREDTQWTANSSQKQRQNRQPPGELGDGHSKREPKTLVSSRHFASVRTEKPSSETIRLPDCCDQGNLPIGPADTGPHCKAVRRNSSNSVQDCERNATLETERSSRRLHLQTTDHQSRTEQLGPIHLIIVGGESGHHARPMQLGWAGSLVEQCKAAGVAVFMKQLGAHPLGLAEDGSLEHWEISDKKGGNIEEFPEPLRIRQFPEVRS